MLKKRLKVTQQISNHPHLVQNLPSEVIQLFNIFLQKGDEIRLVGGCVRDLLINKQVNDFDFATKLLPEEMMRVLKNTLLAK